MTQKTPITIAYGDGIGPEIMQATLDILHAAQAQIETELIEVGEKVYLQGYSCGIPDAAWDTLKKTKILLKGPITTPQGSGYKSLNVTLRKMLGLYANVRPCIAYAPYVPTQFKNMDLVIIRENEEDLYAGIEYRQTADVYECLKIVTRPGCEKIIRFAFDYAKKFNRKKVTCFVKDNIMKMTDGIFHTLFDQISTEYPNIEATNLIVDIGTALLATQPERFDVIVTLNLYGDIISDVAAQVAGSVGLAGSANIGSTMAMFEAIHGSAPNIAGKNIANPSGLINAAIQMLVFIHQPDVAALIQNAWLKTLEDGIHTADIFSDEHSSEKVGTKEFSEAVIARLGQKPTSFNAANYKRIVYTDQEIHNEGKATAINKCLVGVDIYLDNSENISTAELAEKLKPFNGALQLILISSRGLKIWPNSATESPYLQHCCLRYQSSEKIDAMTTISFQEIIQLITAINKAGLEVIKTENLYTFNGVVGYTLAQGQ